MLLAEIADGAALALGPPLITVFVLTNDKLVDALTAEEGNGCKVGLPEDSRDETILPVVLVGADSVAL